MYIYINIYNINIYKHIYILINTFRYFIESLKVWQKPKYNSFRLSDKGKNGLEQALLKMNQYAASTMGTKLAKQLNFSLLAGFRVKTRSFQKSLKYLLYALKTVFNSRTWKHTCTYSCIKEKVGKLNWNKPKSWGQNCFTK